MSKADEWRASLIAQGICLACDAKINPDGCPNEDIHEFLIAYWTSGMGGYKDATITIWQAERFIAAASNRPYWTW